MDAYRAIYNAVEEALRGANLVHEVGCISGRIQDCAIDVAREMQRPSVLYRPSIGRDGNQWCALYGTNLMEGVAGFGNSPDEAMRDFDKNWHVKIGASEEVRRG